jgi:hypothetical protein
VTPGWRLTTSPKASFLEELFGCADVLDGRSGHHGGEEGEYSGECELHDDYSCFRECEERFRKLGIVLKVLCVCLMVFDAYSISLYTPKSTFTSNQT